MTLYVVAQKAGHIRARVTKTKLESNKPYEHLDSARNAQRICFYLMHEIMCFLCFFMS